MTASAWAVLSNDTYDNYPSTFGASHVEAMRIVSTSKVGIGQITPTTSLEVSGTISATSLTVNGVAVTGSGGVSYLVSLTDVSASSASSGMLLQYNGTKWESIGASTALSQTTMVQNWPDAIVCSVPGYSSKVIMILLYAPEETGEKYTYRMNFEAGAYNDITFNSDGSFSGYHNIASSDCNVSIPTLYASGRAFNFIGGQYGGSANQIIFHNGTQGVGDNNLQWLSGTAVVSVTGTVSATNLYGLSVSSTTGTFGSIGVGNLAFTGYVSGTNISATFIQAGTGGTCAAGTAGGIRYNSTSNTLQICTGATGWQSMPSSTAAGVSSMSALTDVSASSPASGMLLQYNGTKWESVAASTALSQTTMVQNWPDAIYCNVTSPNWGLIVFYPHHMPLSANSLYYYRAAASDADYDVVFNSSGTFNSYQGITTTDCNTSISAIYASGRAYNFIGGQYGGSANQIIFHNGTQGVGDSNLQWVSNTAVVSVTGTVSATYDYSKYVSSSQGTFGSLTVNGVAITGSSAGDRISTSNVASGATLGMVVADMGTVSFTLAGTAGAAYIHPTLGFVGPGVSTTGVISGSGIYATGNMYAGAYLHNSDRRLKDAITPVSNAFGLLKGITGVRFKWKSNGKPTYGVIAQDVQKVMPEAVEGAGGASMTVDYDQLIAPLIEAVKELKADNDNLRRDFEAYKAAHP